MESGKLRHRVLVEKETEVTSGYGKGGKAPTYGPATGAAATSTFWADVKPLRATEKVRAQQPGMETAYVVKMRFNSVVAPKHRLVWEGKHLYVEGITDVDGRHIELEILCNEREAAGG
jgi:SPP1 family predicted phage head-tail adaptor